MWMDGSDHNGDGVEDNVTANINVWNDKSGNARHANSKGGDPQFKAGVLNGKGVIDFDGNDHLKQSDSAKSMYNDAAQFSMFAISRYSGTDSERLFHQRIIGIGYLLEMVSTTTESLILVVGCIPLIIVLLRIIMIGTSTN